MVSGKIKVQVILILSTCCLISLTQAFDDDLEDHNHDTHHHHHDQHPTDSRHHSDGRPLPKDKILLRDVKTLVFERNKKTTSRRTHPIHQLSCVGGTAGCRLFTPNIVYCDNIGFGRNHDKYNWKCGAEMSERVEFKHVEVICEGYDYPEDDYILVGSCGLEFTLDYRSPHDHHEKSYYHHLDDHEKDMHRNKLIEKHGPPRQSDDGTSMLWSITSATMFLQDAATSLPWLVVFFLVLAIVTFFIVRLISSESNRASSGGAISRKKPLRASTYGPLTSAVMSTKKAC